MIFNEKYGKNNMCMEKYSFNELVDIIKTLRSPGGCPWDIEQTHKSIRNSFLEEAYEAVDAIDRADDTDLCEELGDVLLQILLHAQMGSEDGTFNIEDVIDGVAKKMILRHPHVFGSVQADTSEKVLENWDRIKMEEKSQQSYTDTLKSVPVTFPSLLRAAKVQKRAKKGNKDIFSSVNINADFGDDFTSEQIGNLLFAIVKRASEKGIDCDEALNRVTDKLIKDFESAEDEGRLAEFKY